MVTETDSARPTRILAGAGRAIGRHWAERIAGKGGTQETIKTVKQWGLRRSVRAARRGPGMEDIFICRAGGMDRRDLLLGLWAGVAWDGKAPAMRPPMAG